MVSGDRGPTGIKPTDLSLDAQHALYTVVQSSWLGGLAIQSDWARVQGQHVAMAASMGLITTFNGADYGRMWRPTMAGMRFLEEVA